MRTAMNTLGRRRRWRKTVSHRYREGAAWNLARLPARVGDAYLFRCERLTQMITKLRFPTRKTRPSAKSVITLALRKNAPDGTGAGRGTRIRPKSANPGAIAPGLVLCRR